MLNLTVAALFLIGTHFGIASTSLRGRAGRRGSANAPIAPSTRCWRSWRWRGSSWRGGRRRSSPLWEAGAGLRHLALALMPLAFLLVVCAVTAPNPTVVGQTPDPDARRRRRASSG